MKVYTLQWKSASMPASAFWHYRRRKNAVAQAERMTHCETRIFEIAAPGSGVYLLDLRRTVRGEN